MSQAKASGTKQVKKTTKKRKAPKSYSPEQLKPHHSKPFRKRHYGLLVGSILTAGLLLYLFTSTSLANQKAVKDARKLISSSLGLESEDSTSRVISTYGFSLNYDQDALYASGLESKINKVYVGPELATPRSYSVIRLGSTIKGDNLDIASVASGSMSLEYHYSEPVGSSTDLAKLEAQLVGVQNKNFTITKSSRPTIAGEVFLKSDWSSKATNSVASALPAKLTSYVGVINGAPLSIVINYGIDQNKAVEEALNNVISSLDFHSPGKAVSRLESTPSAATEQKSDLSLLDRLMMTEGASAATPAAPSSSEKISTLYGPSVVKVYNLYCMDITLQGQLLMQDACSGSTGSGFFVGNQGHIATNGHVAANNPLDIAIIFAFDQLSKGDQTYFNALASASGLTPADLASAKTQQEKVAIVVNKFYTIPDSTITSTNKVENILVGLGEKQPDIAELISMTKARELYPEEDTIKQAKVVAYDYRAVDGAETGGFKSSDVALLKIEGSGYPSTKLGNISSLSQGSGLSIIGYPGAATANQLVEASESRATLTSGKVSSIKSASGSSSQLIETDATIGHGNSGGPAFNDSGEVVGIATYTIDGSGEGNGVFNYVRDIADFSTLASSNSVDTSATNETQDHWSKGVEYFYQARYSKAIKEFATVKSLYPQHPKADQLSALAQQKITAGEEVKDFPIIIVGVAAFVAMLLVVLAIILILRHKKKHKAYQEHVAQGTITPPGSIDPTQTPTSPTPVQDQPNQQTAPPLGAPPQPPVVPPPA